MLTLQLTGALPCVYFVEKLYDSPSIFAAVKCRKALGELLGRLSSHTTIPADVWKLYAEFHLSSEDPADHDKVLQGSI